MKKRGQVGLEFMLVTVIAFFTLITFILVLSHIMTAKHDEKAIISAEDLALSLRQEIVFASEAEVGYSRVINLPATISGIQYDIILGETNINTGYFELVIEGAIFFEVIPITKGVIEKGNIKISKTDEFVFVEVVE